MVVFALLAVHVAGNVYNHRHHRQGPPGCDGLPGPRGSIGNQGSQGGMGAQGNMGSQGTTGIQGSQGITGTTGTQGATGFQGSQGGMGEAGVQGVTGSQGSLGITGIVGSQGVTGLQGSQGIVGTTGIRGTTGPQGGQGATGLQGSPGITGVMGSPGVTGSGIQGVTGLQGTQGITGMLGPIGATGAQGSQGAAGTSSANTYTIFKYMSGPINSSTIDNIVFNVALMGGKYIDLGAAFNSVDMALLNHPVAGSASFPITTVGTIVDFTINIDVTTIGFFFGFSITPFNFTLYAAPLTLGGGQYPSPNYVQVAQIVVYFFNDPRFSLLLPSTDYSITQRVNVAAIKAPSKYIVVVSTYAPIPGLDDVTSQVSATFTNVGLSASVTYTE